MKKLFLILSTVNMVNNNSYGQITASGSVGVDGVYATLSDVPGVFQAKDYVFCRPWIIMKFALLY